MKKYLIILCVLVVVVPLVASAQEETLIRGDGIESGGYGGPVIKFMSFAGNLGVIVGGRGG